MVMERQRKQVSKSERQAQKVETIRVSVAVALIALAGLEAQWYGDDDEWAVHETAPVLLSPATVKPRSREPGGWFEMEHMALMLMLPTLRAALLARGWENVEVRRWSLPETLNARKRADVSDGVRFQWGEGWERRVSAYPDEVRAVMRALREDVEWAQADAQAWQWVSGWLAECDNTVRIARAVLLKATVWNQSLS